SPGSKPLARSPGLGGGGLLSPRRYPGSDREVFCPAAGDAGVCAKGRSHVIAIDSHPVVLQENPWPHNRNVRELIHPLGELVEELPAQFLGEARPPLWQ